MTRRGQEKVVMGTKEPTASEDDSNTEGKTEVDMRAKDGIQQKETNPTENKTRGRQQERTRLSAEDNTAEL